MSTFVGRHMGVWVSATRRAREAVAACLPSEEEIEMKWTPLQNLANAGELATLLHRLGLASDGTADEVHRRKTNRTFQSQPGTLVGSPCHLVEHIVGQQLLSANHIFFCKA